MRVTPVSHENAPVTAMAELLVAGFREHWPESWPDLGSARASVEEVLDRGFALVALGERDELIGWIGGLPEYDGRVFELHPLVVRPDRQRQGIGRLLVEAFEAEARRRGGLTATLGTDDVDGSTSLSFVDLYEDLLGKIATIKNLKGHPFGFYAQLGYTITGVMPDANGPGRPDIYMGKRLH